MQSAKKTPEEEAFLRAFRASRRRFWFRYASQEGGKT